MHLWDQVSWRCSCASGLSVEQIAANHGLSLREENLVDYNHEYGWLDGRTIVLSAFHDAERREIAFFHELGHFLVSWMVREGRMERTANLFETEMRAWQFGLAFAERHGRRFSGRAVNWAFDQLSTYATGEHIKCLVCDYHNVLLGQERRRRLRQAARKRAMRKLARSQRSIMDGRRNRSAL